MMVRCKDCGERKRESVMAFTCVDCFDEKLNEFLSEGAEKGPHTG